MIRLVALSITPKVAAAKEKIPANVTTNITTDDVITVWIRAFIISSNVSVL